MHDLQYTLHLYSGVPGNLRTMGQPVSELTKGHSIYIHQPSMDVIGIKKPLVSLPTYLIYFVL